LAWIESHQTLGRHPKTTRAARALGITRPHLVGHLHFLWWWVLEYAPDGELHDHAALDIAEAAEWPGDPEAFVDALLSCGLGEPGFLRRNEDGSLAVHDWLDYAGRMLAIRKANAERKRLSRGHRCDKAVTVTGMSQKCHSDVTRYQTRPDQTKPPIVPQTPQPAPLKLVAPDPPSARKRASADEGFEKFWSAYPVKAGKANALRAWKGLTEAEKALATEKAAVYARLTAGATAIKYAQGWLNGRRWEDDPETWKRLGRPLDARSTSAPPPAYDPVANEARRREALGLDP